ncbi:MAG: tRNA (cytidine(34)-2'-O)-methyltransferase [Pirellulaceae bacterium]|nr:tRNA (cytidine(34)-2'-O)-methyltransferase [Pirellulaceae bacterium]
MFEVVLFQPEIPPNTGNVVRLTANAGCRLHLVRPLGFDLSTKQLRRAGMDYAEFADVQIHEDWSSCRAALMDRRWFAFSARATQNFSTITYQPGDVFLFGPESTGLPAEIQAEFSDASRLRLPMIAHCRSLNLSNTVAIVVYEAWRQHGYVGSD